MMGDIRLHNPVAIGDVMHRHGEIDWYGPETCAICQIKSLRAELEHLNNLVSALLAHEETTLKGEYSPTKTRDAVAALKAELERANALPAKVLEMCLHRGWNMNWTARGCYLHLEASELIEALRGKGDSNPTAEAADVLLVLMSITENAGIDWADVVAAAWAKNEEMMTRPHYPGEHYNPACSSIEKGSE